MIDWPNITATLIAAAIGGLIASKVARHQIEANQRAEREKVRRETARELIEAIDSYVHIAYRDQSDASPQERQRLRKRILSLVALTLPDNFPPVREHLDGIDRWWWQKQSGGTSAKGFGLTATNQFFEKLKSELFSQVFGQQFDFSQGQA